MNPRLGLILMFEGDYRKVNATIRNVSIFSAVSAVLKQGDTDVTATYIDTVPTWIGNMLISDRIGGKAAIPAGSYRYFISGTYGGKVRTWYWDVLMLPQDLSYFSGVDISLDDYNPFVEEITIYEGDNFSKQLIVPGVEFTAVTGTLRLFTQDVTATYCLGAAGYSGDSLTTHDIGDATAILAGDYGYFLQGTYDNGDAKATWYYRIKVLPKQGVL